MTFVDAGNTEPSIDVIGRSAYLREDITISDVIVETAVKPYYAESTNTKQDRSYSLAPGFRIRLAISSVVAIVSCLSVFLSEFALPFGCMAQPYPWGGVLRLTHGKFFKEDILLNSDEALQNVVTEMQVPVVAIALVHVVMHTKQYNMALCLAVLCAFAAWLGSFCNALVWSPSFLNCYSSHQPGTFHLGIGTVTQSLCSGFFSLFAVRRLLLFRRGLDVLPGYANCIRVSFVLYSVVALTAVVIGERFGRTIAVILYWTSGSFLLSILAVSLALFSQALGSLRAAELSDADFSVNARCRATNVLKWERLCISSTLLTGFASLVWTGVLYTKKHSYALARTKYVVYSVDTMVNAYCFAYLMSSSDKRMGGLGRVPNIEQ